ncbi:type II secretion system protein GspG [Dyella sp. Tek66A03]|uniref:type II secretion system protein GspG n=1 Tax=Dyella sp. Tek66A03 TaxID=3458298 RepID=UPI00403E6F48
MTDLKNSQRISYKATYAQISSTALPNANGLHRIKLNRAVEKAAFVQSLRVQDRELAALRRGVAGAVNGEAADPELASAINAIAKLVGDKTANSTMNNAAAFAAIDPEKLAIFGRMLANQRKEISNQASTLLAHVTTQYRNALSVPKAAAAAAAARPAEPAAAMAGAKTVTSMNDAGIALRVTTYSAAPPKTVGKQESVSFKASITIDSAAEPAPQGPTGATLDDYQPSARHAIAWAQKNKPELFNEALNFVQPYLPLSESEAENMGQSKAVVDFMSAGYTRYFDTAKLLGSINGFIERMQVEPVGNLHLERVEMYPAGIERGELIHSVPMAPSETVNISHKEWSVSEREFEDFVQDYFEGYSEEGVADKTDIAMTNESQSKHATALNVGASLSASYASVTLSTNFGYNATSDDSQSKKDSRNHSMAITKKASSRTKKDHKVTFKVTSVTGSEDQSVRVISNPSNTDAMRIDYFQLARKWKVDLLRYGLRMTYDIVLPNPGSGIVTLVEQVQALDAEINVPFGFPLPLSAVQVSNYDLLAAQYNAAVTAPPESDKYVSIHKETTPVSDYDKIHFDSLEFDADESYNINSSTVQLNWSHDQGDNRSYFEMLSTESLYAGIGNLNGKSGHLALDFMYQYVYAYGLEITFKCIPKLEVIQEWRLQAWNQIRQGAEDEYNKNLQGLKDQRAKLIEQINQFDALTLRRMEQEEIMKGVLRWLLGPDFYLVPFNIASLYGSDSNDPQVSDVLDPNQLSLAEWSNVMEHGEFIKYLHNAIEWENVLYFTYPYFWDDNSLWDFKKFLFHPDSTHRVFLRSGAARVVLTIRPGFEASFTQLVETGAFNSLPGPHPYVTIAQEIQNFAKTNYPGFPPANPEQNARPLLYLEQRRVWKEMQYLIQLLYAYHDAPGNSGTFPITGAGLAALQPYVAQTNNDNHVANQQQLALDPSTPVEALLPENYVNVPAMDYWGNPYFYQCPGTTGDYDLISYGADGVPGGTDKDADISANAEASLIATWYEYTPTNALDIGITMNKPNVTPPDVKGDIA